VVIVTVAVEGISKAATVLPVLMTVCTVPCQDRGHINVVLVLQSCSHSVHVVPSSSSDTCATLSDCAYCIGNMKGEEDLDMQGEEKVNVKTEKGIGSEEEECIGVKDEEGVYDEEEGEEEEDMDIKEEEDVGIKEEVSLEGTE